MSQFSAFATPVLPGKTQQLRQYLTEFAGPRKQEAIDMYKKMNISRERDFLQQTPSGDFLIIVMEGVDLEKSMSEVPEGLEEFSNWNMQQMKETTGMDPEAETDHSFPELMIDTENQVPESSRLIAFVAPIQPGKTEQWKQFTDELKGPRRQDFINSRASHNVRERTFLQKTPNGDFVIVTLEGENPENTLKVFAQSTDEFPKWFVQQVNDIHGFDLAQVANQPVPELLLDSKQLVSEPAPVS